MTKKMHMFVSLFSTDLYKKYWVAFQNFTQNWDQKYKLS